MSVISYGKEDFGIAFGVFADGDIEMCFFGGCRLLIDSGSVRFIG